jgi:hypothetical protein
MNHLPWPGGSMTEWIFPFIYIVATRRRRTYTTHIMYSIKVLPNYGCCCEEKGPGCICMYVPPGLFLYSFYYLLSFFLTRTTCRAKRTKRERKKKKKKRVRLVLLVNLDSNGWMIGMTGTWAAAEAASSNSTTRY